MHVYVNCFNTCRIRSELMILTGFDTNKYNQNAFTFSINGETSLLNDPSPRAEAKQPLFLGGCEDL